MLKNKKGFTLIELLLVIAIIAILAAVVFVALDPLKRFQDTRDSRRWSDVNEILHAVKISQIDKKGFYIDSIKNLNNGDTYMIGTATTSCDTVCPIVSSSTNCVDINALVSDGYLASVPVAPNGDVNWSTEYSGYTINRKGQYITITSCESEGGDSIYAQR